ncbi:hypothetical protein HII36_34165 [Nonomuraea sp. NN258]|uniref:hypothetical protein n=1 Tax=Nonomuraea antri TaxID=2730852 RepID=UPI001568B29D|nr:hypothetical protein [Nonomuraea antri]NRQ36848.1 hypothetical protein [Nonomuraea antri]
MEELIGCGKFGADIRTRGLAQNLPNRSTTRSGRHRFSSLAGDLRGHAAAEYCQLRGGTEGETAMGLLIELIVLGAVFWWLYRCVITPWRCRRRGSVVTGSHDAGVWVNPVKWTKIVVELEGEMEPEGTIEARDRRPGP